MSAGTPADTIEADVVIASDLRLPGGTTASIEEEVRAQARAGYRTALLHVNSRLASKRDRGLDPKIVRCLDDGVATLVPPGATVSAPLTVLRNATVFGEPLQPRYQLDTERVVLVVNHVEVDAAGERHFDPAVVDEQVVAATGHHPVWSPISPTVRRSMTAAACGLLVSDEDWHNLIDVDEWSIDRRGGVRGVPVLGRHSRDSARKWPTDAEQILAAWPDDDGYDVRVLGGAAPVARSLGAVPDRWIVDAFGSRDPRDFLAGLDFFVYFHREDLIEAYGRTIMEALASGAVAILPPHFEEMFGEAALYGAPDDVRPLVDALTADPVAYGAQSARGQDFVARVHGYGMHADRVATLLPRPPSGSPAPADRRRAVHPGRVLMVSSNGAGMGHLTRLLAIATRLGPDTQPMFLSLSQAVGVVEEFGFPWEYAPSRGDLATDGPAWNESLFPERFADVLSRYRPAAVVFDGTMPYAGMVSVRSSFPEVRFIWSRRGMWREDTSTRFLHRGAIFDHVLQPGETAAAYDVGPVAASTDAVVVPPVVLVDPADLVDRATARAELGIPDDATAVLITLGAGRINDVSGPLGQLGAALAAHPDWRGYVTRAAIADEAPRGADVQTVSVYPLARYLRAFDAAVSACGYNSFHELLMAGVPTVFVPNEDTVTDDQLGRARYAADHELGLLVRAPEAEQLPSALESLVGTPVGRRLGERAAAAVKPDGGAQAAALIRSWLPGRGARD